MKISGSFITMVIIWLLGFTHFFGGPYLFFKVIFWLALLPFFIAIFFLFVLLFKTKKFFKKAQKVNQEGEVLHVEATIKE